MPELLVLALAAACWPVLVAVDLVAFRSRRPVALLSSFLVGGLLTTVAIGVVIVYLLEHTTFIKGPKPSANPLVDIGAGVFALVLAFVLWRRWRSDASQAHREYDVKPSRWKRMLERGVPLAFVAGIVLNIAPGVFPFVALKDIAELDYPTAATIAVVFAFYVVMFVLVEVPLVGYAIAPRWTDTLVVTFNQWLDRNGRRLGLGALIVIGLFLLVRGCIIALH